MENGQLMLTLTYSGNAYDFGTKITSFKSTSIPSYDFNQLLNGKLALRFDLGQGADKFYSMIDVVMSFAEFQSFITWYNTVKGKSLSISTDLDLFFPNIISASCVIVGYNDLGYFEEPSTGYKVIELKLYLNETPTYTLGTIPSFMNKGIWTNKYSYSDSFKTVENGTNWEYFDFANDSNKWTVDFELISKDQANKLQTWILGTVRGTSVSITTNPQNSNSTTSKTSNYMIESFQIVPNGNFYSASLNLVELANR